MTKKELQFIKDLALFLGERGVSLNQTETFNLDGTGGDAWYWFSAPRMSIEVRTVYDRFGKMARKVCPTRRKKRNQLP